jgi:hypothetical protein
MAQDHAITETSKKPNPGGDPTGRDIMARQFAAALADPTGREVIAGQWSAKIAFPPSADK